MYCNISTLHANTPFAESEAVTFAYRGPRVKNLASIAASLTCLRIENLLRLAALHQEEDGPAAVVAAAFVSAQGRRPDGLWRPEAGKADFLLA
jgi:hypothetical protein